MLYRALFIDLDGVIRHWSRPGKPVEESFGLPPASIAKIAFAAELLLPAITGAISDAHWRSNIARQLSRDFEGCAAVDAVALWSEPSGEVDEATLALLDRCRSRLRVVLVTNATSRLQADLEALALSGRFDAVINSSEVGAAKPAQAFFRAALKRTSMEPDKVLFIDDSQANVDVAHAMGINAHRFVTHRAMADFLNAVGALDPSSG